MCHNKTTENTLKSHIFIKVNEEAFRINPKLVLLTFHRNFFVYKFSISSITGFLGVS